MATFQNRVMARSPYYITAATRSFGTYTLTSSITGDMVTLNGLLYDAVSGVRPVNEVFAS